MYALAPQGVPGLPTAAVAVPKTSQPIHFPADTRHQHKALRQRSRLAAVHTPAAATAAHSTALTPLAVCAAYTLAGSGVGTLAPVVGRPAATLKAS
jgi:hypothetical protein